METNRSDKARLSLLLPTELRERLARYAARQGISKSEAARRALEAGLPVLERRRIPDLVEQRRNLAAMQRIRNEVLRRYGVYEGDLVAEARAERERQNNRVWGLVRDEDETGDGCGGAGPRFE